MSALRSTPVAAAGRTFGAVIGLNVRTLRDSAELTQHELLAQCEALGLRWPRSRLVLLEKGGVEDVRISELVVLSAALKATVPRMFAGADVVALPGSDVTCRVADVIGFMAGGDPVPLSPSAGSGVTRHGADEAGAFMPIHPFERMLAERFQVSVRHIQTAANNLFGRSLASERDSRVIEDHGALSKEERTARRGHVARGLADEIRTELERRGDVQ